MLSLLTLHIFLLWSLLNIPPSYSFGLVTMAPNIQPFEHLPVPVEDERIRCALLGCGMVRFISSENRRSEPIVVSRFLTQRTIGSS